MATVDPRSRSTAFYYKPKKWFVWSTIGLLLFLCVAISVAGLILLRRGSKPRIAQVAGSSMEPALRGPRLKWTCNRCEVPFHFCFDSLRPSIPVRCPHCGQVDVDFDLESASLEPNAIEAGEQLEYMPPRFVGARREANRIKTEYRGFRRGDLVVIQDPDTPDDTSREVKRLVGFPNESIAIRNGDLWINEERIQRTYIQLLSQSLLVDPLSSVAWESSSSPPVEPVNHWQLDGSIVSAKVLLVGSEADEVADGTNESAATTPAESVHHGNRLDFKTTRYPWISNEYSRNAHDSHDVIMVGDIGCAIQVANAMNDWQSAMTLRTPQRQTVFVLDCSKGQLSISIDGMESNSDFAIQDSSHWIVVIIADGQAIAGTSERELLRIPLAKSNDTEIASEQDTSPISVECRFGRMMIEQRLVFRDIHYRGAADAPVQTIEAGNGVVVLGDNVSLSNDSRQRWEDDLGLDSIKGIMLKQREGLEALLWQR